MNYLPSQVLFCFSSPFHKLDYFIKEPGSVSKCAVTWQNDKSPKHFFTSKDSIYIHVFIKFVCKWYPHIFLALNYRIRYLCINRGFNILKLALHNTKVNIVKVKSKEIPKPVIISKYSRPVGRGGGRSWLEAYLVFTFVILLCFLLQTKTLLVIGFFYSN